MARAGERPALLFRVRSRVRLIAVIALTAAAPPLVACTLDFNRYDPADASPTEDATGSTDADATTPTQPTGDGSLGTEKDAAADVSADADGGPCAALPGCLQQATSCGSACGQDYQQCLQGCDAQSCADTCRSTEQSCLGKCLSTCIACTVDGGCPASSECLGASHP
jgi:hypothetical protein